MPACMRKDTMNCEEYRQEVAADPSFDGGAGHLSECRECQAFRTEMRLLDEQIRRVLAINVPALKMPELPVLDDAKVVALDARKRRGPATWFAIAATVVLAALVSVQMFTTDTGYDSLADEVLAHLDHEPIALRPTRTPVSDQSLTRVVPATMAQFDRESSLITYARSCVINGKKVPHLVVQGERGPITILLMPNESVAESVPLDGENTHGVILPVGDGSVAIIGVRDEPLEGVEKSVLDSVRWSI